MIVTNTDFDSYLCILTYIKIITYTEFQVIVLKLLQF